MIGSNIVSPTHLILVVLVVLLVFGPKRLPELGRGIGSAMREFKGGISQGGSDDSAPGLESHRAGVESTEAERSTVGSSR